MKLRRYEKRKHFNNRITGSRAIHHILPYLFTNIFIDMLKLLTFLQWLLTSILAVVVLCFLTLMGRDLFTDSNYCEKWLPRCLFIAVVLSFLFVLCYLAKGLLGKPHSSLRVRFPDGSVHIVKNYQAPDLVKIVGKADRMFRVGVECEWVL